MEMIDITIKNLRNIKESNFSIPFEKGLYAFVGENGCGKSTIMLALSLIVKTSSRQLLSTYGLSKDTSIKISIDSKTDEWKFDEFEQLLSTGLTTTDRLGKQHLIAAVHYDGFYEGSIFYGSRFDDYYKIESFTKTQSFENLLRDADKFVEESLGYILHNDKTYYKGFKKLKNRSVASYCKFKRIPYFIETPAGLISQYQMSSGECMLISLIDFLNNLINCNSYGKRKMLLLIDEVELALHPSAIDRLLLFLDNLVKTSSQELTILFSTHSAELIQRIDSKNIYLIENFEGYINVVNPCYPNYAIRSLYIPNGFDFIMLVEDELTKSIVDIAIRKNNLAKSKLCCVLPAGGCTQILKLHHDMITYNTLGFGKKIISIFDGDVKEKILQKEEYKSLPKCFLPIPSVEKYIKHKFVDDPDNKLIKLIGDKYFNKKSILEIIKDYKNSPRFLEGKDNDGKHLYYDVIQEINSVGISEKEFIKMFADDIYEYEKPEKFVHTLNDLLK